MLSEAACKIMSIYYVQLSESRLLPLSFRGISSLRLAPQFLILAPLLQCKLCMSPFWNELVFTDRGQAMPGVVPVHPPPLST